MADHVLTFAGAAAAGPQAVGGKGWNLGRLTDFGFPVPPGCVVTARAYRAFLAENGLDAPIEALAGIEAEGVTDPATSARLAELQAAIRAGRLPSPLAAELSRILSEQGLDQVPVAIRSSATAEDGVKASFAGIHESYLNVIRVIRQEAIVARIKDCYASLWSPRALAYRRRLGIADRDVAAAVVIQKLVPAQAAGVAFSADPITGRRDRIVITASLGLGESVVSGAVEPDEVVVEVGGGLPRIVARRLGDKGRRILPYAGGGTYNECTPADEAAAPALDDEAAARLALLVQRIEGALAGAEDLPQDVEWAWDGRCFWVVQARPITAMPVPNFPELAGQPVIWSNANLKDVMPGIQPPLVAALIRQTVESSPMAIPRAAGLPVPPQVRWTRLFHGRLYFNLSAMQWSFYQTMGRPPAEINQGLGGHQPEIDIPAGKPRDFLSRTARFLRSFLAIRQNAKEAPARFTGYWDRVQAMEQENLAALSHRELLDRLATANDLLRDAMPRFMLVNMSAGGITQSLTAALEKTFPGRGLWPCPTPFWPKAAPSRRPRNITPAPRRCRREASPAPTRGRAFWAWPARRRRNRPSATSSPGRTSPPPPGLTAWREAVSPRPSGITWPTTAIAASTNWIRATPAGGRTPPTCWRRSAAFSSTACPTGKRFRRGGKR